MLTVTGLTPVRTLEELSRKLLSRQYKQTVSRVSTVNGATLIGYRANSIGELYNVKYEYTTLGRLHGSILGSTVCRWSFAVLRSK